MLHSAELGKLGVREVRVGDDLMPGRVLGLGEAWESSCQRSPSTSQALPAPGCCHKAFGIHHVNKSCHLDIVMEDKIEFYKVT